MSNQPIDPDLEIKREAFRVRREQLLKDLARLDESDVPGRVLEPKSEEQLKQMKADLKECAEDTETETSDENHE
ncbi:MAG: hypothetical protein QM790_10470 [Nibricoccus sp.]